MTFLAIAVVVLSAAPAAANSKEAEALLNQAKGLLKDGNAAQACPLLEKSQALEPAASTLLELGGCQETTGQQVLAFLSFEQAAALASRSQDPKRAKIARDRAGALKDKLSWVSLSTVAPARGFIVWVNDLAFELSAAGRQVPVDPGQLKITAHAIDREPWTTLVTVASRQTVPVVIPVLPELKWPDDIKQFEASLSVVPLVAIEAQIAPRPKVVKRAPTPNRTAELGLLSGGAVVAAAGIAGLALSFNTHARLQQQQPGQPSHRTPTVTRGDLATIRWLYPASWVAAGVGLAAATTGAVLFLKAGSSRVALVPTPSGVGLVASGSF